MVKSILISSVILTACFLKDEKKDPEILRSRLIEYCQLERQLGIKSNDSIQLKVDTLKIQMDSIGQGIPADSIQKLSTKIKECVDLYEWRNSNPRPKKKVEYIHVD